MMAEMKVAMLFTALLMIRIRKVSISSSPVVITISALPGCADSLSGNAGNGACGDMRPPQSAGSGRLP